MADKETEAEWAKSKRIEAERMKAAQALNEKVSQENVAYLDPQSTKVKGWSSDANVIMASAERMGNKAVILAFTGVVLGIIGYAGGMVTTTFNLGMAGVIISALPSGAGFMCLGVAVLMAIITIGNEIVQKVKYKRKFSAALWSAAGALATVVIYIVVRWVIFRFS